MAIDFNLLIDNYLKRRRGAKQIGKYYPSEIGGCIRKTWYSYKLPKEIDKKIRRIFKAGDMLHEFVSDVIRSEKNKDIELLDSEMPIRIQHNTFLISGRIDDLVLVNMEGKKYLIEVKSTKFLPEKPNDSHMMQLQLYMHALSVHSGLVLYVQKNDLQTKTFEINYNEKVVINILDRFSKLHFCLNANVLPEAEAKLTEDKSWLCNYCDYAEECEQAGKDKVDELDEVA